jgi:hypothetical protein
LKIKHIIVLFIFVLNIAACSNGENPKEHLGEIYSIVLDSIMEKDDALSSDLKYIAIDMSNFDELKEKDKKEVLSFFKEKYKVGVMDASLDQLKAKGLYNANIMGLEEGVLLRIENMKYKLFNNVFFEGSKYRSAKGSIGVESTIHFKEGKWQVKESKETWIS